MTYREGLILRALAALLRESEYRPDRDIVAEIERELAGETKAEVVEPERT